MHQREKEMKKGLLWSIVALAAIVIVAGFHMQLETPTQTNIPESMLGNILYVCPATSGTWDSIAFALRQFTNYIIAGIFFAVVLLAFGWGWQLYQNLLSDKFKRESFKTVWMLTKWCFWITVFVTIVLVTPNHFRRVEITNAGDNWVLCDADTPGARVVKADAVHAR